MENEITNEVNYKPTNYEPTNYEPQLKRVLVVISPELVKPGAPKESALVMRAVSLAKATGCELEFFHVCYDGSLTSGFFADDVEVGREQLKRRDQEATLIAELVVSLSSEGVTITHDTRWDAPRSEAILRKINETQPDLVMKQSRDHRYVMGLIGNTDWDLIRQSPAHLWFVSEEGDNNIDSLVTAVGASTNNDEILAAADYGVFSLANLVAECFDATNTPVHAYQVPLGMSSYAAYTPGFGSFVHPTESEMRATEEALQQIAGKHGRCIEAFAEYFHIDPRRVRVAQGRPSDVLTEVALDVNANLIVAAARNLSDWERWNQPVTAEPLLADAACDVLFVKDAREALDTDSVECPSIGTSDVRIYPSGSHRST